MASRAIIFDLDDTLYPEEEYVLSGLRAVSRWVESALGVPRDETLEAFKKLRATGHVRDTFDEWAKTFGLLPVWGEELTEVYRSHRPVLRLFPGIKALVETFPARVRLGVVTDGFLRPQVAKVCALGAVEWCDAVVYSEALGRHSWKPSPAPFRHVTELLDVPPSSAIYVGDNPTKDFKGARSLGLSTIWGRHSNGQYTRLEAPDVTHAADVVCSSIEELKLHLTIWIETGEICAG